MITSTYPEPVIALKSKGVGTGTEFAGETALQLFHHRFPDLPSQDLGSYGNMLKRHLLGRTGLPGGLQRTPPKVSALCPKRRSYILLTALIFIGPR